MHRATNLLLRHDCVSSQFASGKIPLHFDHINFPKLGKTAKIGAQKMNVGLANLMIKTLHDVDLMFV